MKHGETPHPEVSSRRRGATPPPPARLSRFLVRYVPGDHLVHGLARMPNPFFAHREIDDGDTASRGHALHFFARHVAHEPRGHAVEPPRPPLAPAAEVRPKPVLVSLDAAAGISAGSNLVLASKVSQPAPSFSRPTVSSIIGSASRQVTTGIFRERAYFSIRAFARRRR